MPKQKKGGKPDPELSNIELGAELEDTDFGIIFNQDGDLKMVLLPEAYMQLPPMIKKVFKAAGIPDPDTIEQHTIH